MAKHFVETRTKRFIGYFEKESLLTSQYFDQWARSVAGETEIAATGQVSDEFMKLKDKLKSNCTDCNPKQMRLINAFLEYVKKYIP
jgi:hypothetical protein